MNSASALRSTLRRIDGRGYKAYRDLRGAYDMGSWELHVDHVQGDPFAAPSKVRLRVPTSVPESWLTGSVRQMAVEDFLARRMAGAIEKICRGNRGIGKSGLVFVDRGGQEVLRRTAIRVTQQFVEARIKIGLPAAGRRVLGRQAQEMLLDELPLLVEEGLRVDARDADLVRFYQVIENQEAIRDQLDEMGMIAFIGNGAILPRRSGISQEPLDKHDAVVFQSPASMEISVAVPHAVDGLDPSEMRVRGMGIPRGVTLIVGGGYHGKSTLLRALELGVYPHIPGDGRERVVTIPDAVKILAEDGRRVEKLDISAFVSDLPLAGSTTCFSSEDASGSTSQAANIVEAMEMGARALFLDEDTCATNFMVRDARMQALVHKDQEPITPFIDRVKELYRDFGVSTILVMGGCGDYFDVADTVIKMHEFRAEDVTAQAGEVAGSIAVTRINESPSPMKTVRHRVPLARSFDASRGKRAVKVDVKGVDSIRFGRQDVDLRHISQLVDSSQTRAIAYAMVLLADRFLREDSTMEQAIRRLFQLLDAEGLDVLDPFGSRGKHPGDCAMPRPFELAAAINRLRTLSVKNMG